MNIKPFSRIITLNFLTAALYFFFSLISFYLTVPQSKGVIIYLSAAIAFVAILTKGKKLLPGVWFGGFIASFWTNFLDAEQNHLILLAALIATGVSLQAWLSALLISRFNVNWKKLTGQREIILFLLLSGPIGCTVSAIWGSATFYLFSEITSKSILINWLHWWAADIFGVVVLSPILLILILYKRQPWRDRIYHVAFPALLSLLVTFSFFFYTMHTETSHIRNRLENTGLSIISQLSTHIRGYEEAVASVINLKKTYPEANYKDFQNFTQSTLATHPELQAVSWNPRIIDADRVEFEKMIAKELNLPEFKITHRDTTGRFVNAAQKEWYVPIAYISPLQPNIKAVGFDISSNSSRLATLDLAIETKHAVMTPPINLVQNSISNKGVLLILPLLEDNSHIPSGFAVGVIRIANIMQVLLRKNIEEGLDISIIDIHALGSNNKIFSSIEGSNNTDNLYSWSTTINLANRTWELTLTPSASYINANQSFLAWQVLLIGITLTSFLQILLLFISGRHFTDTEKLQLSANVFQHAHEGIMLINNTEKVIDVNPTFTEITGYNKEDIIGKSIRVLSSERHDDFFHNDRWNQLRTLGQWQGEVWNRKKNGELYAELLTISSVNDDQGIHSYYVGLFSDITLHKEQQTALEMMAHYDVLTGLPNRVLFADRSKQAFAHSKRSNTLLAICFLDIDHFKQINDTFGHQIGDLLITEVAKRIQSAMREENTVSRLGGDEFTLLLNDLSSNTDCELAIQRILDALAKPFLIDEYPINITVSCGITVFPTDNENLDTLIRHADQAMYKAKLSGRNQYQFFDLTNDLHTSQKHLQLQEIQNALITQEFRLYYQPKVNMKTGEVFGLEALIRWYHPEKGIIYPLDFLPIIEGTDLELQVGDWVINEALSQLQQWLNMGYSLEVSVNISSYHLQSPKFIELLRLALSCYPFINPNNLQLEILESSALGDLSKVSQTLQTCQQALGVKIALDDFGTGYSSLTHLRNLRSQVIKIDQSFVRDILDDPNDYMIVDGVIGLTKSFGQEPIAEGVETTDHGIMLLSLGCTNAQGYGIAKPMPSHKFLDWLFAYVPNSEWITFSNQIHNPRFINVTQLRLVTKRWFSSLEKALNSPPSENQRWPLLDVDSCHYSALINRARQENSFESEEIENLNKVHLEMFTLARTAFNAQKSGDLEHASKLLEDINKTYTQLIQLLINL